LHPPAFAPACAAHHRSPHDPDLDSGTDLDMLDAFEAMVPKLRYRHPHNPPHVGDHMMAALIGTSVSLPFERNCCWARGSV